MEPYVEPWRPGIGDPTVMGWLTVIAYFAAAVACGIAHRRNRASTHRWVWPGLTVVLVLLGFNKQLDLQSWFTYVGKRTAIEQGWYEDRRPVQVAFIVSLAIIGLAAGALFLHRLRGALGRFRWALVGTTLLIAFIVIRAASFHHVDLFLQNEIAGIRPNWVLELGGIALIGVGALRELGMLRVPVRRRRARKRVAPRKRAEEMGWLDILREILERGGTRGRRGKPRGSPQADPPPRRRGGPTRPRDDGFRVVVAGPPRRQSAT